MEAEEDEVLNTNNNNSTTTTTDVHTLESPLNTDEPQCEPESKQSPPPPPPPQSLSRLDELQIPESPRPSSPPAVVAAGNLGDEDLVDGEESKEVEVEAVETVEKEDEESIEGEEESEEVVDSGGDSPPPPEPPVSGNNNEDDVIADVAKIETETEAETVVADFSEENKIADVAEDEEEVAVETEVADLAEKLDVVEEERGEADVAEDEEEESDVADRTVKEEETDVVEATRVGEERSVTIGTEEMAMLEEETKMDDVAEEMEKVEEETEEVAGEAEETEMDDVAEEEEEMAEEMDDKVEETATEVVDVSEEMEEKMEETEMADVAEEMETEETEAAEETEVEEVSRSGGGKRKRGKSSSKAPARVPVRKKLEEDVCFICFDGGDLVLCDRRGCPKAYHPACVNRDEAFFRAKGRWNCGWHLCSNCEKNAYYMCYTCTFSLCKACIKDAVILCVRGNKGFCETCMKTVMLIEKNEQGNRETAQVDFDDKTSWEYLFKDYWIDLKGRLCLTSEELAQAKNPWKGFDSHGKQESPDELYDANDVGSGSDSSAGNAEVPVSKRRRAKKRSKSRAKEGGSTSTAAAIGRERTSTNESVEWASKELLEFVMHMKNGDKSVLSQFDVQALLLEYIKRNKLRDPRRKSQIICDSRLQNLFGKQRVGHFEMLKLLESHFLTKDDSQADDLQGSVVDTEANQSEADGNSDVLMKVGKDKRRKTRKKGDGKGLQSNLDDYAAIDMHNINLIYLRRTLVEDLLEDTETFHDKAVGSFVRIRISGSAQKQDLYRLVQVVGTNKVAEPYRVGKKMTDFLLEILNLNKTEVISIDIISNQEFTEDECKRLRQSIKCGLINRLTVGDIQEKAMAFQAVRVKDWLETEIVRLSHLRDRASDLGRRKELRECVEKLQLLKSPEERQRRLEEIPEIHADPNMDPSYESEEDEGETDDKKQENYMRPRGSGFSRRGREPISPRKGGFASNDSWGGTKNYSSMNRELSRNMSDKGFSNKGDDAVGVIEIGHENLWNQGRDKEIQQSSNWEKPKFVSNSDTGIRENNSAVISQSSSKVVSDISPAPPSTVVTHSAAPINETEKIWHYQDPARKVQGPFSIVQLRKWNNTGYFPADLRIWRTTEKQEDSLPLTDVLTGKLHNDPPSVDNIITKVQMAHSTLGSSGQTAGESWKSQPEISSAGRATPSSLEVPKYSTDRWGSDTNLPSPTPNQTPTSGTKGQAFENQWSPTPAQPGGSLLGANSLSGGNGGLQPPAIVVPESSKLTYSSVSHMVNPAPKTEMGMPLSSTNAPRIHSQSTVLGELHQVQVNTHLLPAPGAAAASMNLGADMKNVGAILQNLVLPSGSHNPPVESQAWGSGSVSKPDMIASAQLPAGGSQAWGSAPSQKLEQNNSISMPVQPAYGQWGNPSSVHNSTSALSAGNSTGVFPAPASSGLLPSDPWRPPVPVQPNIQPHAPPNVAWGMGVNDNQGAAPRQGPDNQNTGWGQMPGNPNMVWGGPVPANANPGWVAPGQGPVPGNTNPSWVSPGQPQAPGNANPGWAPPVQGQVPGNAVPNWAPPGQGPAPVNANPGWVPAGQGPLPGNANQGPGNANQGWGAPTGKPGMWGNEQNHSGDRYSGQRDRGSHSGDSGYGGGKPWNRQSSFGSGGGSSRPPFKGQRVCKFHESGHCKKGSSCDYMHT